MNDQGRKLTPGTFFATILVLFLGFDSLTIPEVATKICGPSGYWTPFITVIMLIPLFWLIFWVQRRFPESNLFEVSFPALGKPMAILGNLIFLSTFYGWLILAIRDSMDLVQVYLLNRTPLWTLVLIFLAGAGYIAINGLSAATRLAAFIAIPTIISRTGLKVLSLYSMTATYIQPVFSARPWDYLHGGAALIYNFLPLATIFLIYPLLIKAKSFRKLVIGATGGATLFFFLAIISTIGIFGVKFTLQYIWPNLAAVTQINFPFLVLEQVGLLFLIIWLTMFFAAVAFYLVIIGDGIKAQFPGMNYNLISVGLLIAVGIGSMLFPNSIAVHQAFKNWRQALALIALLYPFIVYFVAILKGVGGKKHAS